MDFGFDDKTTELRDRLSTFLADRIKPSEQVFHDQLASQDDPWAWSTTPVLQELRAEARELGLWNLFLPPEHADSPGLTNLQYAPLAELTGRASHLAPAVLNCSAPDTGNMEVLSLFGTPEQKERWLQPLLAAEIRSSFAMTEPDVASSDATNIETRIERDGDEYVLNGRKWWITGAMNPQAQIFITMGKTDPTASRHRQQSQVLVPRDTPGLEIVRGMEVFGYDDHEHGGHAEIVFNDVRVPVTNLIGEEGAGFAIAQARLGPGRIHHCMRAIGVAESAIELMCRRADSRVAFGRPLSAQGVVRDWIAESRVKIEQLRLLVLKTAWLMDTVGNRGAHSEIQAIKIATPQTVQWILDKAIQVHGAGGLSQDFPLASAYAGIRTLRFADGPDEVHKNSLAKAEIARQYGRVTAMDETQLLERVDALLASYPPDSTDRTDFLHARFDAGLAWVHFPEGLGGLGLPRGLQPVVEKALFKAGAPDNDPRKIGIGLGMAAPTILAFGTEEQKQRYLRPLWCGEEVWCQLFSEPGAGSDLAGLATRAVPDGDGWVVNGQKVWTSSAHIADRAIMIVRTDPDQPKHAGLSYFILDMHDPGVDVRPLRQITGEAEFNEVFLTDARIPDSDRLGEVGEGWKVANATLSNERVAIGGGAFPREYGMVMNVAETWRTRPELRTPETHERLLRGWIDTEVARITATRLRQKMAVGVPGPEGSAMKLSFARINQELSSLEVDLLGDDGLRYDSWEMRRPTRVDFFGRDAGYRYLRAKGNSIEGGTSEVLRNVVSERVLGLPTEHRVDKDIPWKDLPR